MECQDFECIFIIFLMRGVFRFFCRFIWCRGIWMDRRCMIFGGFWMSLLGRRCSNTRVFSFCRVFSFGWCYSSTILFLFS